MSGGFNSGLYPIVRPQQPVMPFWMGEDQDNVLWQFIQGDTFAQFIQLFCECQLIPDISNWFFTFTIKASMDPNDPDILCQTIWQELHGQCSATALIVSPYVTATVPEGRYAFDLKYRTVTGSVQTVVRGEIDVLPAVDLSLSVISQPAPAEPNLAWNWLWLCLQDVDTPATDDNINSWLTQGGSLRTKWATIQPDLPSAPTSDPNDPSYNWQYFDTEIARWTAANKLLLLRITMQNTNAPQWVYQLPGMRSYVDTDGNKLWIWDDPVVTPYLNAMLDAFISRYSSNKNIVIVASDITSVTSGDFTIPFDATRWGITAHFPFPDYGQTAVATPVPGTIGLVVGQIILIKPFGYVQITQIIGPATNPTGVVLQNMSLPGNAHSGFVGVMKVMYVDNTGNLLVAFDFNADAVVAAQNAVIARLKQGFPHAVVTYSCGRTSEPKWPPTHLALAPTPDYICQQVAEQSESLFGAKFGIQKNGFNAVCPLPQNAATTKFNIFLLTPNVQRGGQTTWWTYGDLAYKNNHGNPADPLTVLTNTFNIALAWNLQWLEIYHQDDQGLRGQWTEPPNWGIWANKWRSPLFSKFSLPNKPKAVIQPLPLVRTQRESLIREKTLRDLINRQNAMGHLT